MNNIETTKQHWIHYQKYGGLQPHHDTTPIFDSWERCAKKSYPYRWIAPYAASGRTLTSLVKRNNTLLDHAAVIIEDTYDLLTPARLAFLLTDDNGCIMSLSGHPDILDDIHALGFDIGCFLTEDAIGTHAINLTLHNHQPNDVYAAEHFNKHLHPFKSSAAPIFDHHGKLKGIVGIMKYAHDSTEKSLSIATLCAKNISLKITLQREQTVNNHIVSSHNATLEHIDDGVITWSQQQEITLFSPQAERLLGIPSQKAHHANIFSLIHFPPHIETCIETHTLLTRKQTVLEINGQFIEAIITLRPLNEGATQLLIHPIDKIRELAQQQIGIHARHTFNTLRMPSKKMRQVLTVGKRAIASNRPILITGEEGVGKSDLAMAIHNQSDYRHGPFITINCRAIDPKTMRIDVLGNEDKPSKFELAHGGTLFLEKLEFLCPTLQAVLLKMLKTGLVCRHNSNRQIPVKFQLITSSHSDMEKHVSTQTFSKQLYYEIATNVLYIPPLRVRKEDIQYKIEQTIDEYNQRHHTQIVCHDDAMQALLHYAWPGNNAELRNRIEQILLHRETALITLANIPPTLLVSDPQTEPIAFTVPTLADMEKQAIIHAWHKFDGKMCEMAKALDIGRTTLWRKIIKYELDQHTLSSR